METYQQRHDRLYAVVRDLLAAHDAYVNHKTTNPDWVKEEALRKAWNKALEKARKAVR